MMGTLLLAAWCAAIPVFQDAPGGLLLRYRITEERVLLEGGERTRVERRVGVLLSDRAFELRSSDEGAVVYDFELDRLGRLDPARTSYRQFSLLAEVARRNAELGDLLDAGLEPEMVAAIVGCDVPRAAAPQPIEEGGTVRFVLEDRSVATVTFGARRLDAAGREMVGRWLFYRAHLHPEVRRAVLADGRVFARLDYVYQDRRARYTVRMRLAQARTEPGEWPARLDELQRVFDEKDVLERAARRALTRPRPPGDLRPSQARFLDLADRAVAEKRYLQAVLLLVEAGLQTGRQPLRAMMRLAQREAAAPAVRAFFRIMQLADRDGEKALGLLAQLDASGVTRREALDVFRAKALARAGRTDEAEAVLLSVLDRNPYLTAAYKDLGDLYHDRRRMQRAWLCWDTGRALVPDHPLFEPVKLYEDGLRARFAEAL